MTDDTISPQQRRSHGVRRLHRLTVGSGVSGLTAVGALAIIAGIAAPGTHASQQAVTAASQSTAAATSAASTAAASTSATATPASTASATATPTATATATATPTATSAPAQTTSGGS